MKIQSYFNNSGKDLIKSFIEKVSMDEQVN